MVTKTCHLFIKDEIDNRTKVVFVFDVNVSNEEMIEAISKYFEDNEMDENDEYAPIQSKIDCDVYARNIVLDLGMCDFDLDRYWVERNVQFLTK